jgi:hypothetical protein
MSAMAASGPIALATSLAPWAKLSKAAAKISGTVNIELTRDLSVMLAATSARDCRSMRGRTRK